MDVSRRSQCKTAGIKLYPHHIYNSPPNQYMMEKISQPYHRNGNHGLPRNYVDATLPEKI